MKSIKTSLIAIAAVGVLAGLGACSTYDDGYYRDRSSVSIGVSTGPAYDGTYRDRDGDGVPNRYDRDRDGDGVPNRYDRDRDGDGVPNRFDTRPNNPYRP